MLFAAAQRWGSVAEHVGGNVPSREGENALSFKDVSDQEIIIRRLKI